MGFFVIFFPLDVHIIIFHVESLIHNIELTWPQFTGPMFSSITTLINQKETLWAIESLLKHLSYLLISSSAASG